MNRVTDTLVLAKITSKKLEACLKYGIPYST